MAEQWLVDGYNLLYALQSKQSSKKPLSREELLSRVAEFASFKKTDVLLVLDGVGHDAELRSACTTHFTALYSQKEPADAYIEKYLFQNRDRKTLVVVTDDRAIANLARGGGARVLSTAAFTELMAEAGKENSEILLKEKSREHGFNRPFKDKLKDL